MTYHSNGDDAIDKISNRSQPIRGLGVLKNIRRNKNEGPTSYAMGGTHHSEIIGIEKSNRKNLKR